MDTHASAASVDYDDEGYDDDDDSDSGHGGGADDFVDYYGPVPIIMMTRMTTTMMTVNVTRMRMVITLKTMNTLRIVRTTMN